MERMAVNEEKKVIEIIAQLLNMEPTMLDADTAFDDLGADSLDLFQVISALEQEFDIDFEAEETEKIITVGDAIEYIKAIME